MPTLPSALSLDLTIGPDISSAEHAANYTAIQTMANAMLAALAAGVGFQYLTGSGTTLTWSAAPSAATYTPVWTGSGSNPAIGNGTLAGRYMQVGKLVLATVNVTAGSTTTFGTGTYSLSLPTTAAAGFSWIGSGYVYDTSAATLTQVATRVLSGATVSEAFLTGVSSIQVAQTVPFTWANGDQWYQTVLYEAA